MENPQGEKTIVWSYVGIGELHGAGVNGGRMGRSAPHLEANCP
jgi:hypothetical protein